MRDMEERKDMAAGDTVLPAAIAVPERNAGNEEEDEAGLSMYVKFGKPYVFEEDIYDGLDMSCLEDLSTRDLLDIEKKFYKLGVMSMNPENTASYAKVVAQKATGMPIEFFEGLPIREMMKIRSMIVNFFYS